MPRFRFHRGSLALDFAGTVGRRDSVPEERLPDRAALAAWLREARLIAAGAPVDSESLSLAVELREAIARSAVALARGGHPAAADVAVINAAARWAPASPALDPQSLTLRWPAGEPVRLALGRVAADAVDLFANRRDRLVVCNLPGCGSLLLSSSRGPARRWCSMETCGNVAKVASHRARQRAAQGR